LRSSLNKQLPGPRSWPLLGVGPSLKSEGCPYLMTLTQRFGRIVHFPLPKIQGVLVSDRDLVKQLLLQTERNFYKGRIYDLLTPVVGRGLVTNQGQSWRKRRRLLNPFFQSDHLPPLDPIIDVCLDPLISRLENSVQDQSFFPTTAAMMELTFSILIEAFFSGDLDHRYSELSEAFSAIQSWLGQRFWSLWRVSINIPTPGNLRLTRARGILVNAVRELISERRRGPGVKADLLQALLGAGNEHGDDPLSDQEVIDEVITFLIAGHDTTALALSFTLAVLAEHPQDLHKILKELDSSQGPPGSRSPWLQLCLMESMRLYPPVYMINRNNKEPLHFKGFDFPAHTTFFLSQYVVHRDPEYWENPLQFKPERFVQGAPEDFSYFPFAGGPRTCLGNHLAMVEATGVLERILPRLVPVKLEKPFRIMANLTSITDPQIYLRWEKTQAFLSRMGGV
jgi:cytochrome P450